MIIIVGHGFFKFCFSITNGPILKTLDFSFYIGSTPTFLYFDLLLNKILIVRKDNIFEVIV